MEKGDDTMGKYVVKKTNTGIKFDLKAGNGEVIANSEIYTTKAACLNGIKSVMTNAPVAAVEDQTVEGFETCKHPKFISACIIRYLAWNVPRCQYINYFSDRQCGAQCVRTFFRNALVIRNVPCIVRCLAVHKVFSTGFR